MSELTKKHVLTGTGLGLGAILALPATAAAEDFQVTNLNDSGAGSLREALEGAAESLDPADRVLFKSKLSGEITLTSGELYINGPLEVLGPGARRLTVSGNDDSRVIYINTGAGADVTIAGLRLADGATSDGGAISSLDADLTVSESTISGNQADSVGGGIFATSGSLTVRSSTISGNRVEGCCGGIMSYASDGTVIENSTISGNSASTGNIGGLYIGSVVAPVDEGVVRNTTIARNSTTDSGGGLYAYQADVELDGTIVADNTAGDEGPDLFAGTGAAFAGSFNLIEDPDGASVSGPGNSFGQDPKLKPLKNNGGPTDTHAFKKSPAKNKIPKGQTPTSDQRGAKRKGKGDIGAYELVRCKGVIVNRVGTAGKDKLKGTKKADGILGLGGNDKLSGKKGKDGLCGGRGKDKLKGGPGKDKLDGGPGKDKEVQ